MTESRFRERRSAHREESGPEPEPVAPEPAPAGPPPAGPSPAGPSPAEPPFADAGDDVSPPNDGPAASPADLDELAEMEVPEASFLELIEPHIEMALRFLGQLPLTPDGQRRVLPRWAKREIDLLGLLEERTRGNLPPSEAEYLRQALDQLRTMYLKATP